MKYRGLQRLAVIVLSLSVLSPVVAHAVPRKKAAACAATLGGAPLRNREQATPGTIIEIIAAKKWAFQDINGCLLMQQPGAAMDPCHIAIPGERYEILDHLRHLAEIGALSLKVKQIESGHIGYFYWSDIRHRSIVITASSTPPLQKKPQPPKIAADARSRGLCNIGDIVFTGHNRVLTLGTVGRVTAISTESYGEVISVALLNGKESIEMRTAGDMLTEDEISAMRAFYGDRFPAQL
mgnify:FL=1